jgi:hypothetical protein
MEAVYGKSAGQELAKREKDDDAFGAPKKKQWVVTNADKKANTPAYQKYKAGDKNYKAADHMKEEELHEKQKVIRFHIQIFKRSKRILLIR